MNAPYRRHTMHGALLGLLAASVAFSYALATSADGRGLDGRSVDPRIVGTNLRISNPFLSAGADANFPAGGDVASDPDGFDLGDACFGSNFVRYISALGGVQHYRFTSANLPSGVTLDPSGRLSGTIATNTAASFNATLTDAAGVTRNGYFRLFGFVCPPGEFRFAQDRLPAAQVGHDYITRVEALGATTATEFSVVSGSVQFNGVTISDLETAGLQLFRDGTLAGRPLAPGTLAFTARATRGSQLAQNRAGAGSDQRFTIDIAAEQSIQSVLATLSAQIKGFSGFLGGSQATFSFSINTEGRSNTDFANARFVIRVAGATFSTTLDSFGQSRTNNFRVQLDSVRGTLKVQIREQDFAALLGSGNIADRNKATVIVEVELGTTFIGTEAIQFDTRNRRGRYQLTYKLGKHRQLGGLFQIVALQAADFSNGTAFKTTFLISHVKGRTDIEFGTPRQATVHIGQGFSQTVSLRRGRGVFGGPGVRSLKIDGKRKVGTLQTYSLPQSQTGIPPASSTSATQTFLLGMDIDTSTTFIQGDASKKIFPVIFR
ncbi:MAG TPA: putative Ig domain-containing protein [Planctomycetota bacterium]|nr:putative Ig domain-containing protein [Planctomycetota bacterium]